MPMPIQAKCSLDPHNCYAILVFAMKTMQRKPKAELVRTSISLTMKIWMLAVDAMERDGRATFSEYVGELIRRDVAGNGQSKKVGAV